MSTAYRLLVVEDEEPIAELLEYGTLLTVLELPHGAEVPGWALVHTGERTGWVDRLFIREPEENKEE